MLKGIDTTRAARRPSSLQALVGAITNASPHEPETESLEWKSSLPLDEGAECRYGAARQILGFANRDPDRAAQAFEGCGYLVIGAEPGRVHGVSPLDPADIDNWLSEYLGQDGPQWRIDYVEMQGISVLVFTVEPPRWGDRIHVLRKGFGNAPAGRIFIRRAGKTIEAGPAEIHMLESRSQRGTQRIAIDLLGQVEEGLVDSFIADGSDYRTWRDEERHRLESAISQYRAASADTTIWNRSRFEREIRSAETYDEEVETYLANSELRWQALIWEGLIYLRLAVLKLSIHNLSDRNFSGVEISLTLPAAVKPFLDADEPETRLGAPTPPAPYGHRTMARQIEQIRQVEPLQIVPSPSVELSNDGNRVVFAPQDVRPHQMHLLPELYLAVPQPLVDDEVEVEWRATSTSADGDVEGVLSFPVSENPHQASYLVASAEDASN